MRAKYSFICEAANVAQNGNLNVLGIFQNISSSNFPVVFSKMVYVNCIEFHRSEVGEHQFKVNFIDDDGKPVIPSLEGQIFVGEGNLNANLLLEFNNLNFSRPGTYAIDITVDKQHVSTENITLVKE